MPVLKVKQDGVWKEIITGASSGSNIELDQTLSIEGIAADSKAVGDAVNLLQEKVDKCANVIGMNSGNIISLTNSAHTPLVGLRIFGKTTQNGTPTPDAPVPMESVGNGGSITVKVGTSETDEHPQTLTIYTPNGLPGIPVSSGGNYTDENGQQWACDEVDFEKGVYVQRIYKYNFTGNEQLTAYDSGKSYGRNFQSLGLPYIKIQAPQTVNNVSNAMCNVATIGSQGQANNGTAGLGFSSWGGIPSFYFSTAIFGDGTVLVSAMKAAHDNGDPYSMIYELDEPIEHGLTAEERAQYSALHTNYPNTAIFNDGGVDMDVKYYTPTTAVQMIHNPSDEGKILSIDEHGCVILSDSVAGSIDIDLNGSDFSRPNSINADTLGGKPENELSVADSMKLGGSSLDDVKSYVNNQITNRVIHSGGKNLLNINNPTKRNTIIDTDGSFVENSGFMTYRIPSTGGYMTISFAPQSRFDALRYASEIDGVITRYSSLSGVTVDASQWDALWISIMPIDDFVTDVMTEAGSVATEYEPYYEGLKELTYRGADLVWKNASSDSEFNAQSISLDLSEYYKVEVEFLCAKSSDIRIIFSAITGSGRYNCVSDNNNGKLTTRIMRAYSDKLSFNSGYIYSTYGSYTEDDNVMIPLKIYGIKGEFYDCIKS